MRFCVVLLYVRIVYIEEGCGIKRFVEKILGIGLAIAISLSTSTTPVMAETVNIRDDVVNEDVTNDETMTMRSQMRKPLKSGQKILSTVR